MVVRGVGGVSVANLEEQYWNGVSFNTSGKDLKHIDIVRGIVRNSVFFVGP